MTASVPPNPDDDDLRYLRQTQAVVEQAKGLLMARFGCGPDVAFELLRGASQYSNVKVHVIAERLVGQGLPSLL